MTFVKNGRKFSRYYNLGMFSKIFCVLSFPLFLLFIKIFLNFKVKYLVPFPLKEKPLILASNHVSYLDPFFIGVCFFRQAGIGLIRFMTRDSLIKKFGFIIKHWGCFPVFQGKGLDVSLKIPREIIKRGNSVLIFPRGRRMKRFHRKKGKIGASVLALENNIPILPIKIIDSSPGSLKNLFLRKRRIRIIIGKPFLLSERIKKNSDYNNYEFKKATEIIVKEISKLC